eukprot:scaffold1208_cov231-Pinguiococcus_pyrenoidosus.AAC.8
MKASFQSGARLERGTEHGPGAKGKAGKFRGTLSRGSRWEHASLPCPPAQNSSCGLQLGRVEGLLIIAFHDQGQVAVSGQELVRDLRAAPEAEQPKAGAVVGQVAAALIRDLAAKGHVQVPKSEVTPSANRDHGPVRQFIAGVEGKRPHAVPDGLHQRLHGLVQHVHLLHQQHLKLRQRIARALHRPLLAAVAGRLVIIRSRRLLLDPEEDADVVILEPVAGAEVQLLQLRRQVTQPANRLASERRALADVERLQPRPHALQHLSQGAIVQILSAGHLEIRQGREVLHDGHQILRPDHGAEVQAQQAQALPEVGALQRVAGFGADAVVVLQAERLQVPQLMQERGASIIGKLVAAVEREMTKRRRELAAQEARHAARIRHAAPGVHQLDRLDRVAFQRGDLVHEAFLLQGRRIRNDNLRHVWLDHDAERQVVQLVPLAQGQREARAQLAGHASQAHHGVAVLHQGLHAQLQQRGNALGSALAAARPFPRRPRHAELLHHRLRALRLLQLLLPPLRRRLLGVVHLASHRPRTVPLLVHLSGVLVVVVVVVVVVAALVLGFSTLACGGAAPAAHARHAQADLAHHLVGVLWVGLLPLGAAAPVHAVVRVCARKVRRAPPRHISPRAPLVGQVRAVACLCSLWRLFGIGCAGTRAAAHGGPKPLSHRRRKITRGGNERSFGGKAPKGGSVGWKASSLPVAWPDDGARAAKDGEERGCRRDSIGQIIESSSAIGYL